MVVGQGIVLSDELPIAAIDLVLPPGRRHLRVAAAADSSLRIETIGCGQDNEFLNV